jgi:hypothetical protein
MLPNILFKDWIIIHGDPDISMAENMMEYEIYCETLEYELLKKSALSNQPKEKIKKYYFMPNLNKNNDK